MDMIMSLVSRHNKVFTRNRMLVFFSMLSVLIVIALYAIFLQKTQLDSIEQFMPVTPGIKQMVNEWMVAGLLSIIAVTTTLGVFGIYVKDLETKTTADFLTTAASRAKIQVSYVISALLIGFMMTMLAFICCEIFLVATGGELLSWYATIKIIGILLLAVILSSTLNLFLVLFVKTQNAFSTLNTIIGTAIGFLCGVYVPMGALPSYVQSMIHYFPISHTTVLLRDAFMADSIQNVFKGNEAFAENYMLQYGIIYEINGTVISNISSVLLIVGTIMVVGVVAIIIFSRKHK
ncbi:ABC transporter permease [Lysinibacillus sp. FSL H8-0500]|uniref:ABC transporter permease n=1 Tax=Lysinibacillus sp. FSL H8-0500 TaxID=2921393 RepID=UPI0031014C61